MKLAHIKYYPVDGQLKPFWLPKYPKTEKPNCDGRGFCIKCDEMECMALLWTRLAESSIANRVPVAEECIDRIDDTCADKHGWRPNPERVYAVELEMKIDYQYRTNHWTSLTKEQWDSYTESDRQRIVAIIVPEKEVKEEQQESPLNETIDFVVWYSGMTKDKVINAWHRWNKEVVSRRLVKDQQ